MDLAGKWSNFWSAVGGGSGIWTAVAAIGVGCILVGIVMWAYQRRKGQGDSKTLWGWVLLGCVLAAPEVLFPVILTVLDVIIDLAINFFNTFF